jgi:thiosulfate dehydrogenase
MGKFLLGVIVGILVVVAGVYSYFWSGAAPVATSAQAMPFEKRLARTALHKRMDKEMPKSIPIQADENNFVAGAAIYKEQCAVCHGLPNQQRGAIANGMFPKPPQLFKGKGVTDDPAGETYWKVANGIRLTGMPAFKGPLSDTQMWQVSLLLANADKLPPAALSALNGPETNLVNAAVKTVAKTK